MLAQEQIAQYQAQGFLRGGKVLDDDEVEVLRAELDRVIADQKKLVPQPVLLRNLSGNPESPVWQIVNIWEASRAFRALISNRRIAEEAAQLTGARQLRVWHDQIQYKPSEVGGVNMWHQDAPYWPILQPKTAQVTAWIALDDVDASNGCMSMVPGSHQWGVTVDYLHTLRGFDAMPSGFEGRKVEVKLCPVAKGEVHYHHCLTWHGSQANTSRRPRRAIAIHLMTEETCYDAGGNHPMKPFVTVANGARLEGEHFPLVWDNGSRP